jgi:hypothetical protein
MLIVNTSQRSSGALLPLALSSAFLSAIFCYRNLNSLFSSLFCLFLGRSSLVQQTQVCLPTNRNNASENAPVLYGYICETECRNRGPHFAGVDPAGGHGILYALDHLGNGCTGEQGLHAKEVGVEERREQGLVDSDLDRVSAAGLT